jgi:predicted RNA-binding Zn ribbon-like protein
MKSTQKWRAYHSQLGRIRMLGGNQALDLANTVHWRGTKLVDFVSDYRCLVEWAVPALLLTESEKDDLLTQAATQPRAAISIHEQWHDLRASLKNWLAGVHDRPSEIWQNLDLSQLTEELSDKINAAANNAKLTELFSGSKAASENLPLALPLYRSATAIWMVMQFSPDGILRQCQADACGGYFLDQSRAQPRRWCSMDGCGNRAKAARHRLTLALSPL